jgi:cobalt-precorrin-5B (C1)-methyltransferase
LGGISILGTIGWVKPVSSMAYINSIKEELNYAKANNYKTIIFTLGNTAYKQTQNNPKVRVNTYVIDIGNFIYDSIILAIKMKFDTLELWLGIGKCVKIAQGFKNTHNRFGSINFILVQNDVKQNIRDCITIKAVRKVIGDDCFKFDNLMKLKAQQQLKNWFNKNIKVKIW